MRTYTADEVDEMIGRALAREREQRKPLTDLWERLPGHLIDKYEGATLTEELLQQAVAELVRQSAHGIKGDA